MSPYFFYLSYILIDILFYYNMYFFW